MLRSAAGNGWLVLVCWISVMANNDGVDRYHIFHNNNINEEASIFGITAPPMRIISTFGILC